MKIHSALVEQARQHLIRLGAKNIQVLDGIHTGRKSKYKAPLPDVIGELHGKKLAIECGWLSGGKDKRMAQLEKAGYEIIIHFPYLEYFDYSMRLPQSGPWTWNSGKLYP